VQQLNQDQLFLEAFSAAAFPGTESAPLLPSATSAETAPLPFTCGGVRSLKRPHCITPPPPSSSPSSDKVPILPKFTIIGLHIGICNYKYLQLAHLTFSVPFNQYILVRQVFAAILSRFFEE
jgi:hypothetical protein